jgi:hypothetical protein
MYARGEMRDNRIAGCPARQGGNIAFQSFNAHLAHARAQDRHPPQPC